MDRSRTVVVTVGHPSPELFDVRSPTGRTYRVSLASICGWEDRALVEKLRAPTATLSIPDMEIIRRNGWPLED